MIFIFNCCIFIISTHNQPENHLRVRLPPVFLIKKNLKMSLFTSINPSQNHNVMVMSVERIPSGEIRN